MSWRREQSAAFESLAPGKEQFLTKLQAEVCQSVEQLREKMLGQVERRAPDSSICLTAKAATTSSLCEQGRSSEVIPFTQHFL